MSVIQTASTRRFSDHFEPQDLDPQEQRRLRGQLEQIDYAAYVANREVMAQMIPPLTTAQFQRLAVLTATARGRWVSEALRQSESGSPSTPDQVARLTSMRTAWMELSEAYEALRRMVERSYVRVNSDAA